MKFVKKKFEEQDAKLRKFTSSYIREERGKRKVHVC